MSEWTDADVERVAEDLFPSFVAAMAHVEAPFIVVQSRANRAAVAAARALLASGVVVPARVVEEAERERERLREGARAVVVAIDLALDNLRAEYGDVTADRAEESINAHLERAAALLPAGRDRAGEGAGS